jgi:hypothetical protein
MILEYPTEDFLQPKYIKGKSKKEAWGNLARKRKTERFIRKV